MTNCEHNSIDPTNNMCRDCYTIFNEDVECKRCDGTGQIDEVYKIGEDEYGDGEQECPKCEGMGYI